MASASAAAAMEKAQQLLEEAVAESLLTEQVDMLPSGFYDAFVLCAIRVHAVELGRLLCHFTIPARLLNSGNFLHGGATASLVYLGGTVVFYTTRAQTRGSPLEMNISYLDAAFLDVSGFLAKYTTLL
ncbi:uncharacterized protein [Triticum aestivum]|uniref:uncharacterized protein n=1 Tax=Triticum aestivum TaxID=4565 RepID=UPI001D003627|nr:uncharacterized protein LOC123114589 [Triticum aestivum]